MMDERRTGILLHVTSLPSRYGIGDLGPAARTFVDFLRSAKQRYWQILPLNPTELGSCNSPYSSYSAFAGNTLLISPELLQEEGLLDMCNDVDCHNTQKVDYGCVAVHRRKVLDDAYAAFKKTKWHKGEYEQFCQENAFWLDDFCLFIALRGHYGEYDWSKWPHELRDREESALARSRNELLDTIEKEKFFQYLFFSQWHQLKRYCEDAGILIIGDIPIYVDYNSVDVWVHQHLFKLNDKKRPQHVGGVPPDYFSKTGQRWGNPVYRWDVLKETGYAWWQKRIAHNLKLFDLLRVDHFRGFVAYWEVPAQEKTAVNGKWITAPSDDFFMQLQKNFSHLPLIAEDLGIITDNVKETMKKFHFPGMRLFIFAFGDDDPLHPYLPDNYVEECVGMTGTHDTNTIIGWYNGEASDDEKNRLDAYLKDSHTDYSLNMRTIRVVMDSIAKTTIFPMQDILGLDESARMNRPGVAQGNWLWRLDAGVLTQDLSKVLLRITEDTQRA